MFHFLYLPKGVILLCCRERLLQDQLRQAKDSVSTMQKLHELAQSQLFEVRAQSGIMFIIRSNLLIYIGRYLAYIYLSLKNNQKF